MTTSFRALVTAVALCALTAGCASKPKSPPVTLGGESTPGAPQTDLPPGTASAPGGVTRTAQEDLAETAGDRVFFAFDSDALDAEAQETVRRQAAWLAAHADIRARIAGNADERGTREYNLALGARRAAAARQALISAGIASHRLETISYGKERPLDPGSDEAAWARNRNAQTVVIGMASP